MLSCVCLHEGRPTVTDIIKPVGDELNIIHGNEQVVLVCIVTGDDLAGGYWERLNPLQNLSNMSSFQGNSAIQLLITRVRPMHSGEYRCVVYSQWGMVHSDNVTVTIKSKWDSNYFITV